jgi:asparagine synthase (glutamine-hydrolysing)
VLGSALAETGYFDAATLQRMLRDHDSGLRDYSHPLWTVLMFDAFLRRQAAAAGTASAGHADHRERVAV